MKAVFSILVASLVALAAPVAAQEAPMETRVGEKGFTSPPATLDQLDWLVGQWGGEGIGGAPAMESWLPPMGGTMVGTFVQTTGSDPEDQSIMFTEHMYIVSQDGSLALKLKHFNADLTGWEEKDDMLTFRLVAIEPCAAFFNALTLRCDGEDGLIAAVRMKSGGELKFRFERMENAPGRTACPDASTTLEINACFSDMLTRSQQRHAEYLAAVRERYGNEPEILASIETAETKFEEYRDQQCDAVLKSFGQGTIRTMQYLGCKRDHTDARTKTIWSNWLTYMDSTPPILPEPEPTR